MATDRKKTTPASPHKLVWSFGGGVQSTALAVLVHEGTLPRPDLTVIADTGRERDETWRYLREVTQPYLDAVGVTVEIAPHSLARVDLIDKSGLTLMPAWTKEGRLSSYCSGEWKRDAVERWLRNQGVVTCTQWLGFSWDEIKRATGKAHREWCQPAYPLIDLHLTRLACLRLVEAAGLPPPPRSRCYQCPHQRPDEWLEIAENPAEWAKAVEMDEAIRESDEQHAVFLHYSRKPLARVTPEELRADIARRSDFPLFRPCQDSGCFT